MTTKAAKERIKARDNYTCKLCGRDHTRISLSVHHIKKASDGGDNSDENLMTVCEKCHRAIHKAENIKKQLSYSNAKYLYSIYKKDDYKFIRALTKIVYDPIIIILRRLIETLQCTIDISVKVIKGNTLNIMYKVI